jgi:hypothetical protein
MVVKQASLEHSVHFKQESCESQVKREVRNRLTAPYCRICCLVALRFCGLRKSDFYH